MRVFFTAMLLMTALQLIQAKPFVSYSSAEDELMHYYYVESNKLAADSCLKWKNMTETILADNVINESALDIIQQFKQNVAKFQEIFPFYQRFGHNDTLLRSFSNMVKDFQQTAATKNEDKDFLYIQQLLQKLGWNEIREKYIEDFKQLLPELEKFENNISDPSLLKWLKSLMKCKEFECYLNAFREHTYTTKDHLVSFLQKQLTDLTILHINNLTAFTDRLLATPQLSQLTPFLNQDLKEHIELNRLGMETIDDIYQLYFLSMQYDSIIGFYIEKESLPLDELLVILKIFKDQGYEELLSDFQTNYNRFLQYDVIKEYERLKAATSEEELLREKEFWETFEHLKEATDFEQRIRIVNAARKDDFAIKRF